MLEIDDIDETNCSPESHQTMLVNQQIEATADHHGMIQQSEQQKHNKILHEGQIDQMAISAAEVCQTTIMTKEEQMQRLMMQHFFERQIKCNDNLARVAIA